MLFPFGEGERKHKLWAVLIEERYREGMRRSGTSLQHIRWLQTAVVLRRVIGPVCRILLGLRSFSMGFWIPWNPLRTAIAV